MVYRSHITELLAMSETFSHFLSMTTTLLGTLAKGKFCLGLRNTKINEIGILQVCDTVMVQNDQNTYVKIRMMTRCLVR